MYKLKTLMILIVSLMMMSCSSSKTLYPLPTPALPQPTIDQALIQPCPELPAPTAKNRSGHLLWKKQVILLYGECRARHNALVEVMEDKT